MEGRSVSIAAQRAASLSCCTDQPSRCINRLQQHFQLLSVKFCAHFCFSYMHNFFPNRTQIFKRNSSTFSYYRNFRQFDPLCLSVLLLLSAWHLSLSISPVTVIGLTSLPVHQSCYCYRPDISPCPSALLLLSAWHLSLSISPVTIIGLTSLPVNSPFTVIGLTSLPVHQPCYCYRPDIWHHKKLIVSSHPSFRHKNFTISKNALFSTTTFLTTDSSAACSSACHYRRHKVFT